jgi:hypothetical protein
MLIVHILNIFGLTFGLSGTILVFLFGVPNVIDTRGKVGFALLGEDENEKKKIKNYKRLGRLGLLLLSISFFVQLFGEIISMWSK